MIAVEKIKSFIKYTAWPYAHDVRALGLIAFGVVALLVTWSGVQSIQTNYELQREIAQKEQENAIRELENTNLKLQNQYLETDQFLELAARRQFGKAARGETVVAIPEAVALKNSIEPLAEPEIKKPLAVNGPTYQKNFEAWLRFFMHRPPSE